MLLANNFHEMSSFINSNKETDFFSQNFASILQKSMTLCVSIVSYIPLNDSLAKIKKHFF